MALPNYTPSGTIRFGSVPWDNGYVNVRLYTDLSTQTNDISSRLTITSNDYAYIGRNRRLKVSIPADRLYHCNYCMYRNSSLTDGWIYCFVSDVKYVNDSTSEVALETDVFQTYLFGVDWTIPPCFIERATVASEDSKYLLTPEPDFPLVYTTDGETDCYFRSDATSGFIIMSASEPEENDSVIDDILNPQGYYAKPAPIKVGWGIPMGCSFYYCPRDTSGGDSESLQAFLNKMNFAGSVESVVAVYSIPNFAATGLQPGWIDTPPYQLLEVQPATGFTAPARGTTVDGYTPRNSKVLYYPYTFLRLTDFNGSTSELRYELMDSLAIEVLYAPLPTCKAFVYPLSYMGKSGVDVGIVTDCGALGSWTNQQYQNWLAQNAGTIALSVAGIALAGASGVSSIASASRTLSAGKVATASGPAYTGASLAQAGALDAAGRVSLGIGAQQAGSLAAQMVNASHQPRTTKGQADSSLTFATGIQGVVAERVCVKAEIAEQIDEFFDRWGYAVERIEPVDITSRPAFNYVKTQGAAPRSSNVGAGSSAPFTRGRGTPAEALDVIRRAFDNGVTFWHTTGNFGDFSQSNGVG